MPQLLSLYPLTLEQLPTPTTAELSTPGARTALDDLIAQLTREAKSLLSTLTDPSKRDSSPDPSVWKSGKTFNQSTIPTHSYSAHDPAGLVPDHEGRRWFARISKHPGANYDKWRSGLLLDHSENEVRYIESCTQAERLHSIVPNKLEVWTTQYHLAFPTSNRDFTFAILTSEQEAGAEFSAARSFTVVSVPFHAPSRSGFVRAKYVSVEHVIQTQDGVKWVMATASDAAGLVPKFISDMAMPSKIAEDVPSFQSWILKQ
ncbi:BQ5605_C001g00962 [Microbotryum silenes-dioicae]|uniref:BQ5605_C001g00962 protein n=1 Tax=Microbotryum silenes-dioicae TaxID=796604 RepID=A0A2X0MS72_9BASI|nr:BQ5605_C001g00962 [Microbotryum silenes-dioicae]